MKWLTCECYYDAALHKQSTNCPLHDPYRRCENLEAHIDQLESEIAELRKDRERLDKVIWHRMCLSYDDDDNEYSVGWEDIYHALYRVSGTTGREAIDAAIAAAEAKGDK